MMAPRRAIAIRAAFFLFLFFSSIPHFCLSARPVGGHSTFSSGEGAVETGQLRATHTSIGREVIPSSGGVPRVVAGGAAGGGGRAPGASGGEEQPHDTSLVPVTYGAAAAAAAGAAARSRQKSSSLSNYCHGSDLLLTASATFSYLLLWGYSV